MVYRIKYWINNNDWIHARYSELQLTRPNNKDIDELRAPTDLDTVIGYEIQSAHNRKNMSVSVWRTIERGNLIEEAAK